jgi:hypothetical protein
LHWKMQRLHAQANRTAPAARTVCSKRYARSSALTCRALQQQTEQQAEGVVVERVSNSKGSRKAFSQVHFGCKSPPHSPSLHPAQAARGTMTPGNTTMCTVCVQAFCKLTGIETAPVQDITPEQLANAPYPRYQPLGTDYVVQQKRAYFLDRQWTDTDVGYLSFFAAMHAVALIAGPLTFSWDALSVAAAG